MSYGQPMHGQPMQGPRVTASDIRYKNELPISMATAGIGVILMVVFGAISQLLLGVVIGLVVFLITMYFINITNKGQMIQVSEHQFPHLHRMNLEIARNLDMTPPLVFVQQSPIINAYAQGLRDPMTTVYHTALLEAMSEDELRFIMAHEMGHCKLRHIFYMILHQNTAGGIGGMFAIPLRALFFVASRAMEYSADRAGLVGSMNLHASITALIKLAVGPHMFKQMNIQAYMQQIEDFHAQKGSQFIEILNSQTHPMIVNRVLALIRFYRSEEYQRLARAHNKAGTSTLTAGSVGTKELFHRVAQAAEYERDVNQLRQATAQQASHAGAQPAPAQQVVRPVASAPQAISCGQCGVPLVAGAAFCARCGSPVASSAAPQAVPQIAPQSPMQGQAGGGPAQAQSQPVIRRVSRPGLGQSPGAPEVATPPQQAPAYQQPPQQAPQYHPVPQQSPPPAAPAPAAPSAAGTCPSCGNAADPGAKFCGHCGQPMG